MAICRIIFTDGRWKYLQETIRSFNDNMSAVDHTIISNDSQDEEYSEWLERVFDRSTHTFLHHYFKLGLCKSIQEAWLAIPDGFDYVQHLEDDFVLHSKVDLREVCSVLERNPHLSQIWFMRHPWYAAEHEAGGIYKHLGHWHFEAKQMPSPIEDGVNLFWTEHTIPFWTCNPSVYPVSITKNRYPDPPNCEQQFFYTTFHQLGLRSAFWGKPEDEPIITHIGVISNKVGY